MKYRDDSYYIEKVLNGDTAAYSILVEKHKNLVFSIALKILNSREDAEEIAQDAFVKAFHSLRTFENKSKFSTWLYRIVYNAAVSKTRKRSLETIPMDNYVIHNYSEDSLRPGIDEVDGNEQQVMLSKAMKILPDEDVLLLNLFYHGSRSIEDISEITGLSESNVKVKLHRIRKKLYDEMSSMMTARAN
jgi:RNA polymerase sigma-70 factor (ECF subfamily)